MLFRRLALPCIVLISLSAFADGPGFDLAGPNVDIRVERAKATLPISEVPNLQAGDRLWLHPNFPESQSTKYLMIVAFLRGSTNPPPEDWFTRIETWNKDFRDEGTFVTVPDGAEQALIFLAPDATGGFGALKTAVRGRPGAFVRAAQDLQQAGMDRMRLERYLAEIKTISESDPKALQQTTPLLARSLKMKLDPDCFDKPANEQASCLTQHSDGLVMDDPHSQTLVAQLANGTTADLMNQLSYSRLGGAGAYSAYVGAVIDVARIMGSLHSASYAYIPALATPEKDSLNLKLNNPPSFRKPMSVLVVALPPVQKAQFPPLRPLDPKQQYCAESPSLVLPVDGAPLLFATQLGHNLVLHIDQKNGKALELPVTPDPGKGGLVVDTGHVDPSLLRPEESGTLEGSWGFDHYRGPQFKLKSSHSQSWNIESSDASALIVGREDKLHVAAQDLTCVSDVSLHGDDNKNTALSWKATKPNEMELAVPLENAKPGRIEVRISQYGLKKPDSIALQTYAEAAKFDRFSLHAGDTDGVLEGKRLDEVASLQLNGVRFVPGKLDRNNEQDELVLRAQSATTGLQPQQLMANVILKDGRSFQLPATVLSARPKVVLVSKGVQQDQSAPSPIQLGSNNDLPTNARIVFFVKSVAPEAFPRSEQIEVAAADESFKAVLSLANGSLILQDTQTALGIIDPQKMFGSSAFGPMRFRAVDGNGTAGEWQDLGVLVRLPVLKDVRCALAGSKSCSLDGSDLFLLNAVAASSDFSDSVQVPDGFTANAIDVSHPSEGLLYLKLRDDPGTVQRVTVPVVPISSANASLTPQTSQ
ncbi:MAG: hypothetical protein JOZ10_06325 [Acidobacteria bacterium]|nr:hypothetical protein [Acidobacteriota bacterium]